MPIQSAGARHKAERGKIMVKNLWIGGAILLVQACAGSGAAIEAGDGRAVVDRAAAEFSDTIERASASRHGGR